MSDQRIPEIELESPEEEDIEVAIGPGGGPDPDAGLPEKYKGLSKKDLVEALEEARAHADAVDAMKQGISALGDKLQAPARRAAPEELPKPKTIEQVIEGLDFSYLNKEFFEEEGPSAGMKKVFAQALPEIVKAIQQRLPASGDQSANMRKMELLMDDKEGPVFKKYKVDIEAIVNNFPPELKSNPQSWDYALGQVKLAHFNDMVLEEVQKKVGEAGLKKIEVTETQVPFSETAGSSVSRTPGKRTVRLTKEESEEMVRLEAEGMPRNVYLKQKMEEQGG